MRTTICGSRSRIPAWRAGTGPAIPSPSSATIPTIPPRWRAIRQRPCWWMRAGACGWEPRCRRRCTGSGDRPLRASAPRWRDANSLLDDRIERLEVDRTGTVWVATFAGLDRWQPQDHGFAHLRHVAGDANTLSGTRITHVLQDRSGALWVTSTDGGLNLMDRSGHILAVYRHDPKNPGSLASDDVRAILQDQAGDLWVGTDRGWTCWTAAPASSITTATIRRMPGRCRTRTSSRSTRTRAVWSGSARAPGESAAGIRTAGSSAAQRPDWLQGKLRHGLRRCARQRIWIGSMGAGLKQFDPATGEARRHRRSGRATQCPGRSARDVAAQGSPGHAVDRHHGERAAQIRRRPAHGHSGQGRRCAQS